jgi:hypothetical protein
VNEEALAHWGAVAPKNREKTKKACCLNSPFFYCLPQFANSKTEVGSVKYFSLENVSTDGKA